MSEGPETNNSNRDDELLQAIRSKIRIAMASSFQTAGPSSEQDSKGISVVTIFGQSDRTMASLALGSVASAVSLDPFQIGEVLGDVVFQHRRIPETEKEFSSIPDIEAVYVAERSTLVLVIALPVTFFQLSAASNGTKKQEEIDIFRYLTILFSLSHVCVCVDPSPGLSLRYVTIFKALWQTCQKTSSLRGETLKKLHIFPNSVISAARLCVPRLVFVYDCRRHNLSGGEGVTKKIRDMRHALEDQTYRILRHAHVVHPTSANKGLVSIPNNEEFVAVIVNTGESQGSEPMSSVSTMLMQMITASTTQKLSSLASSTSAKSPTPSVTTSGQKPPGSNLNSFQRTRDFIYRHVEQLQTESIRAPASASAASNIPMMCSLRDWVRAFIALDKALSLSQALVRCIDRFLFVNSSFAESLCKQALESAKTLYAEGLPRYYSAAIHEERLAAAKEHFFSKARSSAFTGRYVRFLETYCNGVFSVERRLCERISIFGSVCTLPLHRLPGEEGEQEGEDAANSLPIRQHICNVISKAACNCGRIQADRDDPFTSVEANFEFYQQLEDDCCHSLQAMALQAKKVKKTKLKKKAPPVAQLSDPASSEAEIGEDGEDSHDGEQEQPSPAQSLSPVSPAKSAPSFWSLLSLGSFAVYSMSRGLGDFSGFVNGSHYLYPIGMGPNGEPVNVGRPGPAGAQAAISSVGPSSGRGQPIGVVPVTNTRAGMMAPAVVVYLGVEFECPKGHRFLLETPEKAQRIPISQTNTNSPSSGPSRSSRAEHAVPPALCLSDVPLFFSCCQCPSKAPSSGQLMRVYVLVPPQSPSSVGVSLAVRVQASRSFVFSPLQPDGAEEIDDTEQIRLAPNNLWVLRFPLVYVHKNGTGSTPDDQEMPILPADHADYANFRLHSNFLHFHSPSLAEK